MDLYAMKRNTKRTHYMGVFKKKRWANELFIHSFIWSHKLLVQLWIDHRKKWIIYLYLIINTLKFQFRHRMARPKSIFDKKALEILNKNKLKKSQKLKQKSLGVVPLTATTATTSVPPTTTPIPNTAVVTVTNQPAAVAASQRPTTTTVPPSAQRLPTVTVAAQRPPISVVSTVPSITAATMTTTAVETLQVSTEN